MSTQAQKPARPADGQPAATKDKQKSWDIPFFSAAALPGAKPTRLRARSLLARPVDGTLCLPGYALLPGRRGTLIGSGAAPLGFETLLTLLDSALAGALVLLPDRGTIMPIRARLIRGDDRSAVRSAVLLGSLLPLRRAVYVRLTTLNRLA
jgi:hypothetical protein